MNEFKDGDFVLRRKVNAVGIITKVHKDYGYCDVRFNGHSYDRSAYFRELEHYCISEVETCEWEKDGLDGYSCQKLIRPLDFKFCPDCGGKVMFKEQKKMRIGELEVPLPIRDGAGFVINLGERDIKHTIYSLQAYSYEQGLVFATKEDAEKMLHALSVLVNNAWQEAENE